MQQRYKNQSITFSQSVDTTYVKSATQYSVADGLLAIALALFTYFVSFLLFTFLFRGIFQSGTVIVIIIGAIVVGLIALILRFRNQDFTTVGLTLVRWKRQVIIGFCIGIPIFLLRQFGIISTPSLSIEQRGVALSLVYYFVLIGFVEELLFRGYIQSRLYGIVKSDKMANVIGGVLFAIPHFISILVLRIMFYQAELGIYPIQILWNFVFFVIVHILLNIFYRCYNSLLGVTIIHGFANLYF